MVHPESRIWILVSFQEAFRDGPRCVSIGLIEARCGLSYCLRTFRSLKGKKEGLLEGVHARAQSAALLGKKDKIERSKFEKLISIFQDFTKLCECLPNFAILETFEEYW